MASVKTKPFLLPIEPSFTEHWQAEERRQSTRRFLKQRLAALEKSPSIAPALPGAPEAPAKGDGRKSD